jgi:hypothetical protein
MEKDEESIFMGTQLLDCHYSTQYSMVNKISSNGYYRKLIIYKQILG